MGPNSMPSNLKILQETGAFQSEILPLVIHNQTDSPKQQSAAGKTSSLDHGEKVHSTLTNSQNLYFFLGTLLAQVQLHRHK